MAVARHQSTTTERALVATCVALLAFMWTRQHALNSPDFTSDFDQVWAAARALVQRRNPYAEVGPNAPFHWRWPLYYPLPAVVLTAPLSLLSVVSARAIFAGLGAWVFSFAISRDGWSRWPILLSVTFYVSIDLVQWSTYLAAAFFIPALALVSPAKPNFALPILAGARDRLTLVWMLGGAIALLALSFALRPSWVGDWLTNLREAPHFIPPVARRGGFLILLAAFRWRRPEARWLLALGIIPQAPSFYDQLLLVAVCSRWWESAVLSAGTFALFFWVGAHSPQPDYLAWGRLVGDATVWSCYLPMVVILLLRPNEGEFPFPQFLQRRLRVGEVSKTTA